MHLEPLTRAIEMADPPALREIAQKYLEVRGYREPEVTDGKNDGGTDMMVRVQGGNRTPMAIALTVQKADWQAKVRADCRRAKEALGVTNVLYISSHRRATVDFSKVEDELWADDSIHVRSVDSQAMASALLEADEVETVFHALGLTFEERRPEAVERPNLKEDAAYAFALFGEASAIFRNAVVEQTVLSYLIDAGQSAERSDVETTLVKVLQLDDDQIGLVTAAIDRMLQQQRLSGQNGQITAGETVVQDFKVMRAMRERQWKSLQSVVDEQLGNSGLSGAGLERGSDAVMQRAGALVMCAATATSAAIGITADPAPFRLQMRKRLKELTADLQAAGMKGDTITGCVEKLALLIANSEIGRVLMAGELFVGLAGMKTNQFERAFGASGGSEIHLDASVAIPMITGLLYEPAERRFSQAARRIYALAETRGIPLRIPAVYLEEAASHLLDAVERYSPVLGSDDDLRFSTNAYVAHYSDLAARGRLTTGFKQYVASLGYVERKGSRERHVQAIADELEEILNRYSIRVSELPPARAETMRRAEEAVSFTIHDLGVKRQGRLLEHDAGVIAQFMDADQGSPVVRIFCTWDRLHLRLHTREGRARWQPLDPAMLGDVLILTKPEGSGELLTTVDLAMELDEEEGVRGAAVLDGLVRIEQGNQFDAELLELAKTFKDAFLQAQRENAQPEDMEEAWLAWKSGNRDLLKQPELPLGGAAVSAVLDSD